MKLYFAGATGKEFDRLRELGVTRMLISFYYMTDSVWDRYKNVDDLFLDSGAYSAYTKGIQIDIDKYMNFIHRNRIEVYAALDVIGDGKKTLENIRIMQSNGLSPIPTFHRSKDISINFLRELVDEFEYIALGGMISSDYSKEQTTMWLDRCFEVIQTSKKPNIKVHGFGCTSFDLMKNYTWYSVDSTTWNVSNRFREAYDEYGSRVKKAKLIDAYSEYSNKFKPGEIFRMTEYLTHITVQTMLKWEKDATESEKKDLTQQMSFFQDY